jgi:hypothetical protein
MAKEDAVIEVWQLHCDESRVSEPMSFFGPHDYECPRLILVDLHPGFVCREYRVDAFRHHRKVRRGSRDANEALWRH